MNQDSGQQQDRTERTTTSSNGSDPRKEVLKEIKKGAPKLKPIPQTDLQQKPTS